MALVGSDGGGWEKTAHGIRRIPPWSPALLRQFKALAALANAQQEVTNKKVQEQLAPIADQLAQLVMGQVDSAVGGIPEGGFAFDDPDGGFFCGSTGQPLHPIPPRRILSDFTQLMASSLLEAQRLQSGVPALQEADGG